MKTTIRWLTSLSLVAVMLSAFVLGTSLASAFEEAEATDKAIIGEARPFIFNANACNRDATCEINSAEVADLLEVLGNAVVNGELFVRNNAWFMGFVEVEELEVTGDLRARDITVEDIFADEADIDELTSRTIDSQFADFIGLDTNSLEVNQDAFLEGPVVMDDFQQRSNELVAGQYVCFDAAGRIISTQTACTDIQTALVELEENGEVYIDVDGEQFVFELDGELGFGTISVNDVLVIFQEYDTGDIFETQEFTIFVVDEFEFSQQVGEDVTQLSVVWK